MSCTCYVCKYTKLSHEELEVHENNLNYYEPGVIYVGYCSHCKKKEVEVHNYYNEGEGGMMAICNGCDQDTY